MQQIINTAGNLPTIVAYGNSVRQGSDSVVGQGLSTIKGIVTGELPAKVIVNSNLCNFTFIKPISGFAGRRAENYVNGYKDGESLEKLVGGIVDKALTEERVEEMSKLVLGQFGKSVVKPCVEYLANDPGVMGRTSRYLGNGAITILEGAASVANKMHNAHDYVANSRVGSVLGYLYEQLPETEKEVEKKTSPRVHATTEAIRPIMIEALKPITKWAVEKLAIAAKPIAAKAAEDVTRWSLKKVVQLPFQAASLAAITSLFAEFTPGVMLACAAAPIMYAGGSAIKNCISVCSKRQEEADKRDKLIEIFENKIVHDFGEVFLDNFGNGDNIETIKKTVKQIANPMAINLAEYIMNKMGSEFSESLIVILEEVEPSVDIHEKDSNVIVLSDYITKDNITNCVYHGREKISELLDVSK